MDKIKQLETSEEYLTNEAGNNHGENVLLMCKLSGDKELIKQIEAVNTLQSFNGYLTKELQETRRTILLRAKARITNPY